MNVQLPTRMDKSAFLDWAQGREGRYELVARRVVMMVGGSKRHALIASMLMRVLWPRIDTKRWIVLGSDLAIDIGPETLRYPDVVVDSIGGGRDLTATAPALIAEVVSPSSAMLDLGDKAAEYLRLPSLAAYVVLSQDEPKAWVWVREASGFSPGPDIIAGQEAVIRIPGLQLELPLSEIYADIDAN